MIHASKEVVHKFCQDWLAEKHPNVKLDFVVGSGKRTYHMKIKLNEHCITYGQGMIKSKLSSQKKCREWLTAREIIDRNYFGGVITIQNTLVHTILHEYAHFIQVLTGGRGHRSVHNDSFYRILDRMYTRNTHEAVKSFMMRFPEFAELDFLEEDDPTYSGIIRIGNTVTFRDKKDKIISGTVIGNKGKRISVKTQFSNWLVPASLILTCN